MLDTHQELLHTLAFFEDLDVPVVTEIVYRLKPMQVKRKVHMDASIILRENGEHFGRSHKKKKKKLFFVYVSLRLAGV